ncbi:MAG: peptide chain release factor N(5)-glutamine methyltransferase, partial [Solirubrobacterales bacterium]
ALRAAGVETPRLDAEVFLAEASGRDRAALAADPEAPLEPGVGRTFGEMVRRRLRREPVAYIVGRKGFRGIELRVDRRVLIPRPETELLVEFALELPAARTIADVGAGSGAVALALADELPEADLTATDTSHAALEVAGANAKRLGLEGRVRFARGSLPPAGHYDLLVANLPYVTETEWAGLAPEIREFEPREALVAGPTGLEVIEGFLASLRSGRVGAGAIALEVGAGQAGAVVEMIRRAGYRWTHVEADLAGIERVVSGTYVVA